MQLFAKRFWGFDPIEWPIIAFGLEGNRNGLVRASRPGDRIVFVGTLGDETPPEQRGRILGIAEIGRDAVDSAEVLDLSKLPPHNFGTNGRLRWPKALPMLRAWEILKPPLVTDVLVKQLTYAATVRAVLLGATDSAEILNLEQREIDFEPVEAVLRQRQLNDALSGRPTTGPRPSSWSAEVTRNATGAAFTYAFRFGHRDVWKVGHAKDVRARLAEVNKHVPSEVLGEEWSAFLTHKWQIETSAYDMEQRVLVALEAQRCVGERVLCSKDDIEKAWWSSVIAPKSVESGIHKD